MKWRVACALIPDFAIHCMTNTLPLDKRTGPIALIDTSNSSRIKALNPAAEHAGVALGETAIRAQARCSKLRCITWHAERIEHAHTQLRKALREASPQVEPISNLPGAYWLDARGMRWLGGESQLAKQTISLAEHAGYKNLRVGIADTLQIAQAAAQRTTSHEPISIVAPTKEAEFLAQLSLDELSLDKTIHQVMNGLGLTKLSELAALPLCTLITRFGHQGRRAWEAAQGQDHRRIYDHSAPDLPETILVLEEPVSNSGSLIFGIKKIATELASKLRAIVYSAHCLGLVLFLDDHSEVVETLYPTRPLNHPDELFELVRDRLELCAQSLTSPVTEIRLRVLEMVVADAQQIHMGTSRWDPNALEKAVNRLSGRFNKPVIFESKSRDDHRPEAAAQWQPIHTVPIERSVSDIAPQSPRLSPIRRQVRNPQKLYVRVDAEGHPSAIRLNEHWQNVDARGPERLSGLWWYTAYAYEDYRVVLNNHEVLWVRHDAYTHQWSIQGWFD
jgi:nucleotidyltransferase/DNA polymerase involved in DNA repair